ncbi:hypothetical protein DAI21_15070 [Lelliottia sp. WB101]|uniref:Rap1a/Tai family immunity protein n=1 Tax=Lelliottia sp. WB101 TaxID=2153385 RepID=UPI000D202B51|nr:Rap1a/Tai family immunity protein [Lelliottia sp. WB101]AVY98867.1 hypothetical protein DAI21_15070 [Lelliottia sp. WB101]
MKKLKALATILLLASPSFVLAEFDGNYLYKGYKDYNREYNSYDAFGYMGFVRGVTAMLIIDKKICVDDNFAFSQAFDTVGEYYKTHPKSRTIAPVLPVVLALTHEFPCPAN